MQASPGIPAYIGLGSNLDNPEAQIESAIQALAKLPHSELRACSSLYRSPPMGPQDQADFVNAVVRLDTRLDAEALLDQLCAIERAQGRVRGRRWGPRTLDLDILLYGDGIIDTERLTVPHPGIARRNFVLYPLAELDRQLEVPGLGPLETLIEQCPDSGLKRLDKAVGPTTWKREH